MRGRGAQRAQHGDVGGFGAGFFEDLGGGGEDDCVGCEDEGGGAVRGVDFEGVDVEGFLGGGAEDVFEGGEGGFGEIFGLERGVDYGVCDSDLFFFRCWWRLVLGILDFFGGGGLGEGGFWYLG